MARGTLRIGSVGARQFGMATPAGPLGIAGSGRLMWIVAAGADQAAAARSETCGLPQPVRGMVDLECRRVWGCPIKEQNV
jgi:hypothetical protein